MGKIYEHMDFEAAVNESKRYFSSYKILSKAMIESLQKKDIFFEDINNKKISLLDYLNQKGNLVTYLTNIYHDKTEKISTQSFRKAMIDCITGICSKIPGTDISDCPNISFDQLFDLIPDNEDKNSRLKELKECLSLIQCYFKPKIYETGVEIESDEQNKARRFKNIASNYLDKFGKEFIFLKKNSQIQANGLTATSVFYNLPVWVTIKDHENNDDKTLAGEKKELKDHWSHVSPLFEYLIVSTNPNPIKTMVVVPLHFTSKKHLIHFAYGFISFELEKLTFPKETTKDAFKRLAEIISESLLEGTN